ncbi:MAG: carboxypeptidase-like regulatory domain-containing protein [Bacteroidota bacterium]|nr:carboxypeptidase-like regulatory domain-containing protein [Bacteroidota bacterium]
MRKSYRYLATWLMAVLLTIAANAQTVTVSGTVRNGTSKEGVIAVTVAVKGTSQGTYTDPNGEFSIKVSKLPVVLIFTSTGGYDAQEVTVSDAAQPVNVELKVNTVMGQEVIVAANRVPTRILESPITIERLSSSALKNTAAPSIYEAIGNMKGVDVHTASLSFRTVTTRGFVSSGNTRLIQLIDGMDNQAPGLNFAVGSIIGLTDLDVDNIEILPGASSALYGSGGMNGTILINSKSPFKYTGLSYNIKQGIMHVDSRQRSASPYYNWSFRWAKAFKNKFAIKIAAELIKGNDWQAEDYRNKRLDPTGLFALSTGNRQNTSDFNGINTYGDETSVNIPALSQILQATINGGVLGATGGLVNLNNSAAGYFGAIGNPTYPTNAQVASFIGLFPTALQGAAQLFVPFYLGNSRNYFGATPADRSTNNVTRTGYEEKHLVDYGNLNAKFVAGLHYKITDNLEASLNSYVGTGTTVYTGADRYSLRNLKMAQHKLELRSKNWFVRAYTTQENAGESYNASAAGAFVNEAWKPTAPSAALGLPGISSSWIGQYILTYSETLRQTGSVSLPPSSFNLHAAARNAADVGRLLPGTTAYSNALKKVRTTPIKNGGALFLDKTDLWAGEAQINLSDVGRFSDKVEVIGGVQWKQYVLNSQGTLFADNTDTLIGYAKITNRGNIKISETGGYIQLRKKMFSDVLTLSGSVRYDKQTNFKGKFTPRFTALIKVAKDNNLRLSFQTAYRFPTMQNQYIALSTGTAVLIGCLPEFQGFYKLNTIPFQGYTAASIIAARSGGGTAALVPAVYKEVTPETVGSYELGYKGILMKKLMVDAYVYYSRYQDFLATIVVGQARTGVNTDLLSPFSTTNISYTQNAPETVKAIGWGIGLDYNPFKNYYLTANVFSDQLKDAPANLVTFFNAPKYRVNVGVRNDNFCKGFGFNIMMRWQDENFYEGTFVKGTLPSFATVDAQVTYRPIGTKSVYRIGGTNWGNNYNRTGFGSPAVGGLYYISYGYNIN